MNLRSKQDGFALPMAILVIGFMTAGVVAAFTRVGAEAQIVGNQSAQTAAFAVADAGLASWMSEGRIPANETTRDTVFVFGQDSAFVSARRIRTEANSSLVLVSSEGRARAGLGRAPARRTVAQFARQEPMKMQVLSSWTSLSGMRKNGNSGAFDGVDAAGAQCGDGVTRAGIAVPDGMAIGEHIESRANGDPDVDYMGTEQEMADAIDIDWAGIVNPSAPALGAQFVRCASSSSYGFISGFGPCPGSWPTSAQMDAYPTVLINGSTALPSSGKGVLIVTGNLTLNGNQDWEGVILVGGKITDNGQGHIKGSVISGLNMKLGHTVDESDVDISIANGQKRYEFDSCAVMNALDGATSGMIPIRNAWIDNWSTW